MVRLRTPAPEFLSANLTAWSAEPLSYAHRGGIEHPPRQGFLVDAHVIRAFSRPRHWLAWAAFPLARWWQCRFVRDSQRRMIMKTNTPP